MPRVHSPYRAPVWLRNRHLMTIAAAVPRRTHQPVRRERWELADGDFLDVDRVAGPTADAPLVVVVHGLEGSSRAGYVRGVVERAAERGFAALALNFRGCSGELNRLPRFYHSGETGDLAEVVRRCLAERPGRPVGVVGFSLGGNVVAKWVAELGEEAPRELAGAIAISPPLDLARSAATLDGPGRAARFYRRVFLLSLKRKALRKLRRFPGLFDRQAVRGADTFRAFDSLVTAPLHGFPDADTYWARSSAGPLLPGVRRQLHVLSAEDDPCVPPLRVQPSRWVSLELTEAGGHVAFLERDAASPYAWSLSHYAERRAVELLARWFADPAG